MTPIRVQLSRAKGWRMPPNTVKVDRTTKWGNPFRERDDPYDAFEQWVHLSNEGHWFILEAENNLRGKNLACWCKPGAPCHADILLRAVNR